MPTAIFLDTETTTRGDDPQQPQEVIQLAWLEWEAQTMHSFLFRPKVTARWGALAVHHILSEELELAPPADEAFSKIPAADYWVGHNIDFDWKALTSPPVKRICTLALARSVWPQLDSHTLGALTYFTQGASPETRNRLRNAHDAAADVNLCVDLYCLLCDALKVPADDFAQVFQLSEEARVPKVMTFGKFRDMPISAVDRGYANWYRRQSDPDPYVLEAFRRQGLI